MTKDIITQTPLHYNLGILSFWC